MRSKPHPTRRWLLRSHHPCCLLSSYRTCRRGISNAISHDTSKFSLRLLLGHVNRGVLDAECLNEPCCHHRGSPIFQVSQLKCSKMVSVRWRGQQLAMRKTLVRELQLVLQYSRLPLPKFLMLDLTKRTCYKS